MRGLTGWLVLQGAGWFAVAVLVETGNWWFYLPVVFLFAASLAALMNLDD